MIPRGRWRRPAEAGAIACLAVLLLLLAEGAVRLLAPNVPPLGTDRALVLRRADGGLDARPNSRGLAFGAVAEIDSLGCRLVGRAPERPEWSWLLLGDSVGFGPGVAGPDTVAGLLQEARPEVRILQTAMVGMNLDDYLRITRRHLDTDRSIRRISLFYCLNDLLPTRNVSSGPRDHRRRFRPPRWLVRLLYPRSRLLALAKGSLTRPRARYFTADQRLYEDPSGLERLEILDRIARATENAGAEFEVVILPYARQCELDELSAWAPQRKIRAFLDEHGIAHHDAGEWCVRPEVPDPGSLFLFGDPMHLSAAGHRRFFDEWARAMRVPAPVVESPQ